MARLAWEESQVLPPLILEEPPVLGKRPVLKDAPAEQPKGMERWPFGIEVLVVAAGFDNRV